MPSEDSSLDEECITCGHWRDLHGQNGDHCRVCHTKKVAGDVGDAFCRHDFTARRPADAETAGTSWVSWEETKRQAAETAGEPEAPEEPGPTELAPCAICGDRRKTNEFKAGLLLCEPCIYADGQPYCSGCGSKEAPFGLVSHEGEDRFNELRCAKCLLPPRRPPYAVAYETEGGAQYEIALPGDATIRAVDGALIITHASAVLALTQARPMEAP